MLICGNCLSQTEVLASMYECIVITAVPNFGVHYLTCNTYVDHSHFSDLLLNRNKNPACSSYASVIVGSLVLQRPLQSLIPTPTHMRCTPAIDGA